MITVLSFIVCYLLLGLGSLILAARIARKAGKDWNDFVNLKDTSHLIVLFWWVFWLVTGVEFILPPFIRFCRLVADKFSK